MEELEKVQKEIEKQLCKLLEEAGKKILYSDNDCIEQRLEDYEEVMKYSKQIYTNVCNILNVAEDY